MGYDWIREQVCYKSVDPPSYMQCQDNERDPKYAAQQLEASVKVAATDAEAAEPTVSPWPPPPPTQAPTITTQTEEDVVLSSMDEATLAPAPAIALIGTLAPISEQTTTIDKLGQLKGTSSARKAAPLMQHWYLTTLLGSAVWLFS